MPEVPQVVPDQQVRQQWVRQGCPIPPPQQFKIDTLKAYAVWSKAKVFVETGTFRAETTTPMAAVMPRVYSIELEPGLAQTAQFIFAQSPHVTIIQGDSGIELPKLLTQINERCLFWLDGHNCGPQTGMSQTFGPTPIGPELHAVLTHPIQDHVTIIDDQRYFTGEWGYPTIDVLLKFVMQLRPDLIVDICTDSIRIHPPTLV